MKTKYKYISFVPGANNTVWTIWNHKSDDYLGVLEYKKQWREWELCPEPNTGWTNQCLLDVSDFIKQLPNAKGGRVQAQVSGMPKVDEMETKEILEDIFSHVEKTAKAEYEQTEFYKTLEKFNEKDPTQLLLQKWNRDMLVTLHYMEKKRGLKIQLNQLIGYLKAMIEIVKKDHDDFINRHSR